MLHIIICLFITRTIKREPYYTKIDLPRFPLLNRWPILQFFIRVNKLKLANNIHAKLILDMHKQ